MTLMINIVDFTESLHFALLGMLTHIRFTFLEVQLWGKGDYMQVCSLMLEGLPAATTGKSF